MLKTILCLLFICLFPIKVSASSGYKEITGGTIEVTMEYSLGHGYTLFTDKVGNGIITVPLGHKQTLRITDLPIGCSYIVSEDAEDYVSSVTGKTNWLFRTPDQKMSVVFTNEKSGLIPTGVILNNGGIFIVIGISVLGILLIKRRKNES